jgi:hypothetical protein
MKNFIAWIILAAMFGALAAIAIGVIEAEARTMPMIRAHRLTHAQELRITLQLAHEYHLSKDQTILLLAIRRHEHGRAMPGPAAPTQGCDRPAGVDDRTRG